MVGQALSAFAIASLHFVAASLNERVARRASPWRFAVSAAEISVLLPLRARASAIAVSAVSGHLSGLAASSFDHLGDD